jgi:hypothetical protein
LLLDYPKRHRDLWAWRQIENAIIRYAVEYGVLRLSEEQHAAYPDLPLPRLEEPDLEDPLSDAAMKQATTKSEGAEIGGAVVGQREGRPDTEDTYENRSSHVLSDDYGEESGS